MALSNNTRDLTPQCKIIYHQWVLDTLTGNVPDVKLALATTLDISSQITFCSFAKNNANPSGDFELHLSNSPNILNGDWKSILKRGSWLTIYMAQDGGLTLNPNVGAPLTSGRGELKYLRGVCRIDRVAVKNVTNTETGALETSFVVTGRDFGCIYEDTDIWHNFFYIEQTQVQAIVESFLNVLGSSTTLDAILSKIHDLIFYPKSLGVSVSEDTGSLNTVALQWLLPSTLLAELTFPKPTRTNYWGGLGTQNFQPTQATLAVSNPTDFMWGSAWSNLKQISVPELHELYTEISDEGLPQLIFRPIPFGLDRTKYPKLPSVGLYKDLPVITLSAADVIDTDLGEDDNNRYNSFLLTIASTITAIESNITFVKDSKFPLHLQDSIKRHGFRPMHVSVNTIASNGAQSDGTADIELMLNYNELLYDYWYASVFSESGSANFIGNNAIRIGKTINFEDDVPYAHGRRYYIEGYADTFTVGAEGECYWTQSVNVTRGFAEDDLQSGFQNRITQERGSKFSIEGEYTPR